MKEIQIEMGSDPDQQPGITYVLQLVKFYDRQFDTGTVVREFKLEKGKTMVTVLNVR